MIQRKALFILFLLSYSIFPVIAEEGSSSRPRLAVMPFTAGEGITKKEAIYITETVRTSLIKTGKYEVISNDQLQTMMKTKAIKQKLGKGTCNTDSCIIDLGNALECEKMLVGSAGGAFGEFSIKVKVLNVVRQEYENAEEVVLQNKRQFPNGAREIVQRLTGGNTSYINNNLINNSRRENQVRNRKKYIRNTERIIYRNKTKALGINFAGFLLAGISYGEYEFLLSPVSTLALQVIYLDVQSNDDGSDSLYQWTSNASGYGAGINYRFYLSTNMSGLMAGFAASYIMADYSFFEDDYGTITSDSGTEFLLAFTAQLGYRIPLGRSLYFEPSIYAGYSSLEDLKRKEGGFFYYPSFTIGLRF